MRCVIQRVSSARVDVEHQTVGSIGRGLLVLAGIAATDTEKDLAWSAAKIATLRIFEDEQGRMNLAAADIGGAILAVPNFTVAGDAQKGRRPSFDTAMPPDRAEPMFAHFVELLRAQGVPVETGRFRAHMEVHLINDGPVTIVIESPR